MVLIFAFAFTAPRNYLSFHTLLFATFFREGGYLIYFPSENVNLFTVRVLQIKFRNFKSHPISGPLEQFSLHFLRVFDNGLGWIRAGKDRLDQLPDLKFDLLKINRSYILDVLLSTNPW